MMIQLKHQEGGVTLQSNTTAFVLQTKTPSRFTSKLVDSDFEHLPCFMFALADAVASSHTVLLPFS